MSSKKPGPSRRGSSSKKRRIGSLGFWTVLSIVILIALYALVVAASRPERSGQQLTLKTYTGLLRQDRITSATSRPTAPSWAVFGEPTDRWATSRCPS